MKEVNWICPQCGNSDVYFEYEPGDFTSPTQIINIPWRCRYCGYCGYPDAIWYYESWYTFSYPDFKVKVNYKITDKDGNIMKEWNE